MESQPPAYSQDEVAIEQEILRDRQEETEKGSQAPEIVWLSIWQRLILLVKGRVLLGYERRPGWRSSLPIYAFRCPHHGIQTDYKHGFYERLDCPLCSYSTCGYQPETGLEAIG